MRYRKLGRTGLDVSILGLGCMRFPNEEEAAKIVHKSLELGINYYETAKGYGDSEIWLGKALGGARKKVLVSSKSSPGDDDCATADGARKAIDESLRRLQTDYLDFYQAWAVNSPKQHDKMMAKGGWLEGVLKARDEGLIRHIGVTSHSIPSHVMEMIRGGAFEMLTVQYSLILRSYRDVVRQAAQQGVGVALMGPLAGGLLTSPSPVLSRAFAPDDQVTGAFRYVLSDPGVSIALSGMVSAKEVEENCARMDAIPEDLSMAYQDEANRRIDAMLGKRIGEFESVLCGGCRYCGSICPKHLGPHNVFKAYNMAMLEGNPEWSRKMTAQADRILVDCTRCGKCQTICPQKINVPEHMERVKEHFAKKP